MKTMISSFKIREYLISHLIGRAILPIRQSVFISIMILAVGCGESSVPPPNEADVSSEYSSREKEVVEVVEAQLKALSARDGAGMEALSIPGGSVHAVDLADDGSLWRIRSRMLAEDAAQIAVDPDPLLERIWDPVVLVHGRLAMVWTPYDFWVNGEWSHCGVNVFTLLETEAGWRVSSISYTSEISDCPESPLPPPSEKELGVNQ